MMADSPKCKVHVNFTKWCPECKEEIEDWIRGVLND